MTSWPSPVLEPLVTIHPFSLESVGAAVTAGGNNFGIVASGTYPAANTAYFIPFTLAKPITVVKMFILNGTTASGNIDVGIYSVDGTRLVSAGSTAQAGTSVIQEFNVTDTVIGPGQFYLALVMDNTTGTTFRVAPNGTISRTYGVLMQATAFPLPATATFAAMTGTCPFPAFGLTTRSVV